MKKIHTILLIGLVALMAACSDDEEQTLSPVVTGNFVSAITVTNGDILLPDIGATATVQVTATPADADGAGNYEFRSSNTRIFTIDQDGVIMATGQGAAMLSIAAKNNAAVTTQCKVQVTGKLVETVELASAYKNRSVTLTNAVVTFELGQQVTVAPANAYNRQLKYTSLDPAVATVTENGRVSVLWEGETKVIAEATDGSGIADTCNLTVNITPVTTLSFYTNTFNSLNINTKYNQTGNYDLSPADYAKGTGTSSAVRYQPTNATRNILEYASSDEEVLEIQSTASNGFRLIPKKGGRATITATATDGYDATVTSNSISIYGIYPHDEWRIIDASPTGELQDGGDTWGGDIENMFIDGKQVGFYRQGTTQLPTGSYPYFIIDLGSSIPFNYVILSHSWTGNYNAGSRSNRLSMSGSNDNAIYTPIVSSVTASPAYNYFSVLSAVHTYRYLKVEIWNTTNYTGASGTGVAATSINTIYDFNLGYLPPL
jgi:hypothetical protein